jgi:hypothetical protein
MVLLAFWIGLVWDYGRYMGNKEQGNTVGIIFVYEMCNTHTYPCWVKPRFCAESLDKAITHKSLFPRNVAHIGLMHVSACGQIKFRRSY